MQTAGDIPPVIATWRREALTPVTPGERIETLDVLRGIALLGILAVNMLTFSWPMALVMTGQRFTETRMDKIADGIVRLVAEGKFYPLFSFLFGLGVAIQMERAAARGADFAGWYCRRMAVLLGIGLLHALLIWDGDILAWYAVCGFLLLAFQKRKPRTLLVWAAVCLVIPAVLTMLFWALLAGVSLVPEIGQAIQRQLAPNPEAAAQQLEESIRVFARGSYGEIFVTRLSFLVFMWSFGCFFAPTFVAMFLLGMYAGQRGILRQVTEHAGLLRRLLVAGLALGVPASLCFTLSPGWSDVSNLHFWWFLGSGALSVGGPLLGLAYAAAITLLLQRAGWRTWLHLFAPAGRMALSNYLLQSLICTTIFYSYGLGLFGLMGRTAGLGLAVAIYAAQVVFSSYWLKRFRFGPMEWLWRSLTYGKKQPMRY